MSLEAASASRATTMLNAEDCDLIRLLQATNVYLRLSFAPSYQIQDAFHSVNCADTPDSCSRLPVHWYYLPDADVDGSEDAVSAA